VASTIAVEGLARGRVALAVGTGFTGRLTLGQRPQRWKTVKDYAVALRRLLAGEEIEVDGAAVRSMHRTPSGTPGVLRVPILIAANGPRGVAVAQAAGDGIMTIAGPQSGFDWSAYAVQGTVLGPGEKHSDDTVMDRLAPAIALQYHVTYEFGGPAAVDQLPGGPQWRAAVEAFPERTRHLALHEGHLLQPPAWERPLLDPAVSALTFTGTAEALSARAHDAVQAGATELIFAALGPDVHRELEAMASALRLRPAV
jgi:5,10-methylenetetrahydromethanopterin reductase